MRTAMIAGGSGLVGGKLLRELLDAPDYGRVVALVRRPLRITHPKLEPVEVDFGALERMGETFNCDDAFCCLGTTIRDAGSKDAFRAVDHMAVLAFAWAARRGGAERLFVVSALGADAESRFFYNRVKGETEEALKVLGFSTLVIFRPGLLLGRRERPRTGERLGAAMLWLADPLLMGRMRKYRAIEAGVVARAMARCALGSESQGVRILFSDEIQDLGGFER